MATASMAADTDGMHLDLGHSSGMLAAIAASMLSFGWQHRRDRNYILQPHSALNVSKRFEWYLSSATAARPQHQSTRV
jgi:hypothetical protein